MAPSRRSIGQSVHPGGQFTNDLASVIGELARQQTAASGTLPHATPADRSHQC